MGLAERDFSGLDAVLEFFHRYAATGKQRRELASRVVWLAGVRGHEVCPALSGVDPNTSGRNA